MSNLYNYKKIFSLLVALVLCLAIIGCNNPSTHMDGKDKSNKQVIQEKEVKAKATTVDLVPNAEYNTKAYIFESPNPGPAIMVVGGIHGNEPAGSLAAEKIKELALFKGTLIVVPRANDLSLKANVRTLPEITDINRAYPGKADGKPAERIAFAISSLMKQYKVSMVLDLHEGWGFNAESPKSVGETILPGNDDTSVLLAMEAVEYINKQISDPIKKFSVLANPIAGSTAHYANTVLKVPAFTVETCVKQPLEDRVNFQVQIAKYILASQGLIKK